MTANHKPRPYELECGHKVWFKDAPDVDDIIWCTSCKQERRFTASAVNNYGRMYQEDFWSERIGRGLRFRGGCLVCDYTYTTGSYQTWFHLRDHMHSHYMREHTRFGATLVIQEVVTPSQPPF